MSLWFLITLLALGYLFVCAAIWRFQSRFVFYPLTKFSETPAQYGISFKDITLPTISGTLHGWWMPAGPDAPVILYLHGNGGNIGHYAEQASRLHRLGCSVLLFDYRGYGQSSGPFPSETRAYEDAESVWQWLISRPISPGRICIYGHSLGGAIAIELARHHPEAAALIVESSFTSALAMARHLQIFRIFPLRALVNQRFDSLSKLSQLRMPILFLHGTRDLTVPCRMSHELHTAAPDPKHLVIFQGASHMDCGATDPDLYRESVTSFLATALAADNSGHSSKL